MYFSYPFKNDENAFNLPKQDNAQFFYQVISYF